MGRKVTYSLPKLGDGVESPILKRPTDSTGPLLSDDPCDHQDAKTVELKKNLGLLSGTAMIVGTMIGSGIFISPRGVLSGSGSVGMSLVVWAGCGALSLLGALTYTELGTFIPTSGGEHAYLLYTFGRYGDFIGRVPAFLFDWIAITILRPAQLAVIILVMGSYSTKPFYGDCEPPVYVRKLVTACAIFLIGFINCYSARVAAKLQNVLTACKLIAAGIIIVGGIYMLVKGNIEYLAEGFEDTSGNPSGIALSFYNGLWAYDGWNNLNFAVGELNNPYKNLPRCIWIGLPLVTIVYIMINVGYFAVLSKQEVLLSDAVAVLWGEKMLGIMSWIMPVLVILSSFGAGNGSLFATGRLVYTASKDGHMPTVFGFIQYERLTPLPSLMITVIIATIMIIPGDIARLIGFFNFTAWIFYGLTAACCLILRCQEKDLKRPYRVPIIIPILVVLASAYLVLLPVVMQPEIEYFYAILFLLSGLLLYFPFVFRNYSLRWMDWLTLILQKIFKIVPQEKS